MKILKKYILLAAGVFLLILLVFQFCRNTGKISSQLPGKKERVMNISLGKRLTTLDPALAADSYGQRVIAALYDTPLQYVYSGEKPVRLEPAMFSKMPEISPDGKICKCTLRRDLLFQDAPCFSSKDQRKVTSRDLAFSILRLADARLMSGGFWLIRGKIEGIDEFRRKSSLCKGNDFSLYDKGCSGLRILSDEVLEIRLKEPDPRFIYAFAMPYFSVVSRRAAEYYGDSFSDHPAGSGPFRMVSWSRDYKITLARNPDYRKEVFTNAADPEDRKKTLPLLDRIECYFVRQELSSWLMFLQGELDYCALDGEKSDAVVNPAGKLVPALEKRGIRLISAPFFEINYIGFHFADPRLAKNLKLRQAVSLAFDKQFRLQNSCGRLLPVYSPIPGGIPGSVKEKGSYGEKDLPRAKRLLAEAGYPGGIDPATGRALVLTFDQSGGDTFFRQTAELFAEDLKEIGIELVPMFSNRSRFFQKIRQGQVQMFRLSWTGDYPDAENFFQLFYGPNAGSCNRAGYSDRVFDRMYEEVRTMPDSPARTAKYEKMTRYLMEQCPWIFESCPVSFVLTHSWLKNYIPHDFIFSSWKYLSVNEKEREERRKTFTPLGMKELRN